MSCLWRWNSWSSPWRSTWCSGAGACVESRAAFIMSSRLCFETADVPWFVPWGLCTAQRVTEWSKHLSKNRLRCFVLRTSESQNLVISRYEVASLTDRGHLARFQASSAQQHTLNHCLCM
eukprot:scaffold105344_cov21-Tisochrysis_lutea.AAC.2